MNRLTGVLWRDLRYAVRVLGKSPGFAAVAVASLALGIGLNTAMFSVIHGVLLRPLPYPDPGRLVRVARQISRSEVTVPEYLFAKEHNRAFSSLAGLRGGAERRLTWGSAQQWVQTLTVTTDFLRTLGIRPALGREFTAEETVPSGPRAIVLSNSLWRSTFGADPAVLGRAVVLEDASYTIVGVLPAGFWFPQSADALVPLRPTGSLGDTGTNTQLIARLRDGVSIAQAEADMAALSERFRRAYAGSPVVGRGYRGLAAISYQDWLVGDVRPNLLLLFGATVLLLLIACSNLATLLLTRFAAREKELAVRLALGSSRRRLVFQFLIENFLLAVLGAAAGLLAAYVLLKGLVAWMPFNLPVPVPVRLDPAVLAFALAAAAATALAFTLAPLAALGRVNLHDSLQLTGRSTGAGGVRLRTRNLLVIGEVAVSAGLLVAACLLIQTLYRLHRERLGFTPQGLLTFETPLAPERRKTEAERSRFRRALLERLQALPGVRGVAATNVLPLTVWSNLPTQRDGHPEQSIGGMEIRPVTPAYFELMGIPVRRGRTFAARDDGAAPPVAVVSETVARAWWPQGDGIGDRLVIGRYQGREYLKDFPREVIGVVGDARTILKQPPRPTIFIPMDQAAVMEVGNFVWIVRSSGSAALAADLRRAIAAVDSAQRVRRLRSMDEIVASSTAAARFNASLFGIFAGVALALAAIGVYGLLSFLVAQRRQEIGMRMALGALRADVLMLFLRQGLLLLGTGLALGLAAGFFLTRWLSALLYGVRPDDPASFAAVALLLLLAGLAAVWLPARRAAALDPMAALRHE